MLRRSGRLACLAAALGTVVWSVLVLRALPDDGPLAHVADRIARGDTYDPQMIMALSGRFDTSALETCDTRFLTDALLLQAKAVELQFTQADLDAVDTALGRVGRLSAQLVHCAPMASLGWLGLYWSRSVRDGYDQADLALLLNSYATGPREGWIDLRRNPIAFAVFKELQPALQETVLDEFVDLIRIAQLEQATTRFLRFEAAIQHRILARMDDVPDSIRIGFFKKLRRRGVEGLPNDDESKPYFR